jgi:hypothetical protein
VASLVEAICGARLAARHAEVHRLLADDAVADKLFDDAGLPRRTGEDTVTPVPAADALDAVAPLAPSERYAFGTGELKLSSLAARPARWALLGAALGLAIGVAGTVAFAMRTREPATGVAVARLPSPSPASPSAQAPHPAPVDVVRHALVRLPFLVSHVVIDGRPRDVLPYADVLTIAFDPADPTRHHVVATALDGSQAEGDVVEEDGVAQAPQGFTFLPASPSGAYPPPASSRAGANTAGPPPNPAAPGVVRNGFTKLR